MTDVERKELDQREMVLKLATQYPALVLIGFITWVVWELATPLAEALPRCVGAVPGVGA